MRLPELAGGRSLDLLTLGENSLDFVAVCEPGPALAGKRRLRQFDLRSGGQASTAAMAAARLGLRAGYIGAFGGDEWGRRVLEGLTAAGVDVIAIAHADCPSRIAVITVDERGERAVFEHRHPGLSIAPIPPGAVERARLLLVDATDAEAAVVAAGRARAAGVPTLVDIDRVGTRTDALLRLIDIVIVPVGFLQAVTGETAPGAALARLARQLPHAFAVVTTLGEAGSLCLSAGREIRTVGYSLDVVDTTGAGDAFRAGFAGGWLLAGARPDLEVILRFANATAALNCRGVGAQSSLPTRDEVERFVTGTWDGRSK